MSTSNSTGVSSVVIYINSRCFIIQHKLFQAKQESPQSLLIDRRTHQMTIIQSFQPKDYDVKTVIALLGIVQISKHKYLVLCDKSKNVADIADSQIHQVQSLEFVAYDDEKAIRKMPYSQQIYKAIRQYSALLSKGFYFSHSYQVTRSLQKQSLGADINYAWNFKMFTEFQRTGVGSSWYCPLIQGFVRQFYSFVQGSKICYTLISRRSYHKGGTRYFDRGINDQGFVANFCQTQQIVKLDEFYVSDVQIRGSVPIFFQQVGITTKTKKNRGYQITHKIYKKHISKLIKEYERVFVVNLLSVGKRGQKMLLQAFQKHIQQDDNDRIKYYYCDFHHVVKGGYYEKIDGEIQKLKEMKNNCRFYIYDTNKQEVLEEPAAAFRTNCLDCLDRTNYFQAKLALITLENIFKEFGIAEKNLLEQMKSKDTSKAGEFIKSFRHAWADNGDSISFHYTGTGSTHTDITRDGKRGWLGEFKHKYKSVTRFYNQHFWDFKKMRMLQLLLGKDSSQNKLQDVIADKQTEYIQKSNLSMYIFSWMVPQKSPKALPLFPNESDLIVVALQDIHDQKQWNNMVDQSVDKEKYVLVQVYQVYGNFIKVWTRKELRESISNVEHGYVKFTSYYSVLSNQNACFIRFTVSNSTLIVTSCMLQKGDASVKIQNLKEFHNYAFQIQAVGIKKSQPITNDQTIFLVGNMKTLPPPQLIKSSSELKPGKQNQKQIAKIEAIMQKDEFSQIRESKKYDYVDLLEIRQYNQAKIQFPPTYMWNGQNFDAENNGWADRIWYSSQNKLQCIKYELMQNLRARHTPVIGIFDVQIQKINNQARDRVYSEVISTETMELIQEQYGQEDQLIRL